MPDPRVRTTLSVHDGPVLDAARILVESSTLADHVTIGERDNGATPFTITDDIPYTMWGSGTQGLWRLLGSYVYSGERVSLYEVVARLDHRNARAVATSIAALCRATDHG